MSDRDSAVDRLLRETLTARPPSAPQESCLDAATLAEWADDALPAEARVAAEAHVADCARCQALLAAMARTAPPPPERSWWHLPAIGWLTPVTAAVAAAVLWMVLPNGPQEPAAPESDRVAVAQPPPAAATEQSPAGTAPPLPPGVSRQEAPSRFERPAPGVVGRSAPSAVEGPRSNADERPRIDALAKNERERKLEETQSAGRLKQQAAPLSAEARATPPESTPASVPPERTAPATPPPAAPAPTAALRSAAPAAAAETVITGQRPADGRDALIVISRDPAVRWRAGAAGVVERSADSGATWQPQPSGVRVRLVAGVSPAPTVCWLVGARGTVLLSTDGTSWRRVPFPETVDLTGILATDDKAAIVTAADGRTFMTSNGGQTWSAAQDFQAAPF